MSFENAKQNLREFAKELGLELAFDENNTCILGIDNTFSLHLTYEPNSKRLYLYSPIIDQLPTDQKILLQLYELLLEGALLGGQMAGGGVGVAVKEGLILMHAVLEVEHADEALLRRFAPVFVEAVERWRKIADQVAKGNFDDKIREDVQNYYKNRVNQLSGQGGRPPMPGSSGKPGDGFIKI